MYILGIWASSKRTAVAAAQYIAVAHATSPFISAYPWNPGFGTKYANPATLPGTEGFGVGFM